MYYLIYFSFWLITALPLRVQYLISDIVYYIMYYIIKYRRNVVRKNLINAFPAKTQAEILNIEKKFYHHLSDIFIEMMCQLHLSKKNITKRMTFKNPELITQYFDKNTSVMVMTAHYANWEWLSSMCLHLPTDQTFYGIYKQLTNKNFDRLMRNVRQHFGAKIIEAKSLFPTMLRMKNSGVVGAFFMIADQRPSNGHHRHWAPFLHQDTPVMTGTEQLARKFNYPVLFMSVERIKRGHYTCEFEIIDENPKLTENYSISEKYLTLLEKRIEKQPEFWLWTHDRWKHKRPTETN